MLTLHGKRSGKFWFANRGFRGKVDFGLTFAVEGHLPLPRKARGLFTRTLLSLVWSDRSSNAVEINGSIPKRTPHSVQRF
jgi:hypothetical protein